MDQAVIIKELTSILEGLRKIRQFTWGLERSGLCTVPIDEEIEKLEELINQMTYKGSWNGVHPMGQS